MFPDQRHGVLSPTVEQGEFQEQVRADVPRLVHRLREPLGHGPVAGHCHGVRMPVGTLAGLEGSCLDQSQGLEAGEAPVDDGSGDLRTLPSDAWGSVNEAIANPCVGASTTTARPPTPLATASDPPAGRQPRDACS